MAKFKNLEQAKKQVYEQGEYLYLWLNELKATCKTDWGFKRQIRKFFADPSGVYEYWEQENERHRSRD